MTDLSLACQPVELHRMLSPTRPTYSREIPPKSSAYLTIACCQQLPRPHGRPIGKRWHWVSKTRPRLEFLSRFSLCWLSSPTRPAFPKPSVLLQVFQMIVNPRRIVLAQRAASDARLAVPMVMPSMATTGIIPRLLLVTNASSRRGMSTTLTASRRTGTIPARPQRRSAARCLAAHPSRRCAVRRAAARRNCCSSLRGCRRFC